MEEFRDIPGYEGLYQISNLGRVKSFHFKKETILIPIKSTYLMINLSKNKKIKTFLIHRLMMLTFNPDCNFEGAVVNHRNGIKTDNRLDNLEWCTQLQNIQHSRETGLNRNIGNTHHSSKLKEHQIPVIRNLYKVLKNYRTIGRLFKIDHTVIGDIINNKIWTHV